MSRTLIALAVALCTAAGPAAQDVPAPPALKVLATLPTYGVLAAAFGGDAVEVVTICRPGQDLHGVAPTPSLLARARDAGLLLHTGLDAEPWLDGLLRSTGNVELMPDSRRSVALSDGLALKEVPAVLSRAGGDLHAYGNVHLWADPYHVRSMAARVAEALAEALPAQADAIRARHADFHARLTQALVRWLTEFQVHRGRAVVCHHGSWIYLLDRLGLRQVGTLEPKPRVAPTASHLEQLVETMRSEKASVILREPWQFPDAAEFAAGATGARVVVLSTHPGWPEGREDLIAHFEHNLAALAAALATPTDG